MPIHSFHLVKTGVVTTARAILRPPTSTTVPGLSQAECMTVMRLGSPLISPGRMQVRHMAMFAAWEDEDSLDQFLMGNPLGRVLARGWHVRLEFLRRWGHITEFDGLPEHAGQHSMDEPVVAVTLARLKLPQVPRFIRWGKPVEEQVRDHPGTTLALAAMHPVRTVSTFTVWTSAQQMTDMVHGHSQTADAERHAVAMGERRRKPFHFEFTTLRFRCLGEYGQWKGQSDIVPTS